MPYEEDEDWGDPDISVITQEIRIVRGLSEDGTAVYACRYWEDGELKTVIDQVIGLGMIEVLRLDYLQRIGAVEGFPDYEKDEE